MPRQKIATQYPFRKRLDRQWVALRLAKGVRPQDVAAIERAEQGAVYELLQERSFQRLLGAWREHLAVSEAERLERLTRIAMDILELGLLACDRATAAFFVAERAAGRHPGRTLAWAVEASLGRAGDPSWQRPVGEGVVPVDPPAPPEAEPVIIAGDDPAVQEEAATASTGRRLACTRLKLKRRLMAELEREASLAARPVDILAETGLSSPADWVLAISADPDIPIPAAPERIPPTPERRRRVAVTRAVHRYALARLSWHVASAVERDRLIDVLGHRPGQEALAAWRELGP